jgi:hypothetical protein
VSDTRKPIGCSGEGDHEGRPYMTLFFVGATLVVALCANVHGCTPNLASPVKIRPSFLAVMVRT